MDRYKLIKNHSRLMAVLLILVLLNCNFPVARASEASGSCGEKLSWSLSEGTLTIEGTGAMWDFQEPDMAPWYPYRESITKVVFPDRMTSVGSLAFYDCSRLSSVDLPERVTSIGEYAFASCESLEILDLGSSLSTIDTGAFYGCWELVDLRLPQGLQTIGNDAFYDCRSLTAVTVPDNVTSMGSAVFAYCTSLVRAEIQSKQVLLPDWTFFGCEQLNTVILPETVSELGNAVFRNCDNLSYINYNGSMDVDKMKDQISADTPVFGSTGFVTEQLPDNASTSGTSSEKADGSVLEQSTTVTPGENSTVSSTVDHTFYSGSDETYRAQINVTIENDDGWKEALENLEKDLHSLQNNVRPGAVTETAQVAVYVKDSEQVSEDFVEALAGRNVEMTVITKDGSSWKIDCAQLVYQDLSGEYDLRYALEPASQKDLETMNVQQGYQLWFQKEAEVNAEVLLQLPDSTIRQTATLFQRSDDVLIRHQSVVVDPQGYAHFRLGYVTNRAEYLIGINVPGVEDEAVIPESLKGEYAAMNYEAPVEYVITGRTSSWGMEIGQVTLILVAVMIGSIVIIGFVMFSLNKRKLKRDFAPDLQPKVTKPATRRRRQERREQNRKSNVEAGK